MCSFARHGYFGPTRSAYDWQHRVFQPQRIDGTHSIGQRDAHLVFIRPSGLLPACSLAVRPATPVSMQLIDRAHYVPLCDTQLVFRLPIRATSGLLALNKTVITCFRQQRIFFGMRRHRFLARRCLLAHQGYFPRVTAAVASSSSSLLSSHPRFLVLARSSLLSRVFR